MPVKCSFFTNKFIIEKKSGILNAIAFKNGMLLENQIILKDLPLKNVPIVSVEGLKVHDLNKIEKNCILRALIFLIYLFDISLNESNFYFMHDS